MPNQSFKLSSVDYEMLLELSRKARLRPEQYLSKIINEEYGKRK